jgi:DNA-binding response OmpR family regulator
VTIRILADREPYASFAEAPSAGEVFFPFGPLRVLNGPPALDGDEPDVIVLPAVEFLYLLRRSCGRLTERRISYIAYGPVALMAEAFDLGCVDYIREPWTFPELKARLGKFSRIKFRAGGAVLTLIGSSIRGAGPDVALSFRELSLLRLLVLSSPFPVTKAAAGMEMDALSRTAASLRRKLESAEPSLGSRLHTVRGLGYRLDVSTCG